MDSGELTRFRRVCPDHGLPVTSVDARPCVSERMVCAGEPGVLPHTVQRWHVVDAAGVVVGFGTPEESRLLAGLAEGEGLR